MTRPELQEWRLGWPLTIAAGLCCGLAAIPFYSKGLFLGEIHREFGWSLTQLTAVLAIPGLISSLAAPFVGRLADESGARRIGLIGIVAYCLAFASLGLLTDSMAHYVLTYVLIGLAHPLISPVVWTLAVGSRFNRSRGTALCIALSGTNLMAALVPLLASYLIADFGWRSAYLALGAIAFALTFPFAYFLIYDARDLRRRGKAHLLPSRSVEEGAPILTGVTRGEAMRQPRFWIFWTAFLLIGAGMGGLLVHFVPMLTLRGISMGTAAAIASSIGLAAIVSRIVTGILLDRVFAAPLSAVMLIAGVGAVMILLSPTVSVPMLVLAAVLIGIMSGAELDIFAYMCSRYFGMRAYGAIYGALYVGFGLGLAVAPMFASALVENAGSYAPYLYFVAAAFAVSAVGIMALGRYPERFDSSAGVATAAVVPVEA